MKLDPQAAETVIDFKGLADLRYAASKDKTNEATLREVAGHFESLFVSMMLKSMREAKLAEGLFDNNHSDMYREMADKQLALDLSRQGGFGMQQVIMRQLGGEQSKMVRPAQMQAEGYSIDAVRTKSVLNQNQASIKQLEEVIQAVPIDVKPTSVPSQQTGLNFNSPESFVQQLWPLAQQTGESLGVKPEVILSQAALETGWGKHIIQHADGKPSYNLFNIKADKRWDGEYAAVGTIEYRGGVAINEQAKFRVYNSYQESFDDYVSFLQTQPRYRQALEYTQNPERFVEELHKAGYATDPAYADKIKLIMRGERLAQFSLNLNYS